MSQIDKEKLIKALKEFNYVSTQSGPIEPSRTKIIKAMTQQTLSPVSKPQDGDDWDKREYKLNKDLSYGKNLITTKDLYKKVFTEAVTNTAYRGMRMNLSSIDMKETHCKFIINRRDHEVMVELYYPNENENITVKLLTDNNLSNLYEVPLDSPQFMKNFGYTILKTCDELIDSNNTYDVGDDLDTMQTLGGFGNDLTDLNDTLLQPSAMLRESVDSDLGKLLNLCNAVALMEADEEIENAPDDGGEQAPGAEAFSMGGDGGMPEPPPMDSGDVNGTDADNGDDANINFRDALLDGEMQTINADGDSVNGNSSALDNLSKIVAARMADMQKDSRNGNTGVELSSDEIYHGTVGLDKQAPRDIINAFFEYFNELDAMVTQTQVDQFMDFLTNPGTENITLDAFDRELKKIFPDKYDVSAGATGIDDVPLMGEDNFGAGADSNINMGEPVDVGGIIGGGGFMDDGSFGAMMDQVNPSEGGDEYGTEAPDDVGMDLVGSEEFGADNDNSQQAVDKQDEAIGALTNI